MLKGNKTCQSDVCIMKGGTPLVGRDSSVALEVVALMNDVDNYPQVFRGLGEMKSATKLNCKPMCNHMQFSTSKNCNTLAAQSKKRARSARDTWCYQRYVKEHDERFNQVLERLSNANINFNEEKCKFRNSLLGPNNLEEWCYGGSRKSTSEHYYQPKALGIGINFRMTLLIR